MLNVTLTAPVVLREIRHACIYVMDVREDAIPVSRSEMQNDELEKLWDKPAAAMHPRTSPAPSESDYESAPGSPDSFYTAMSEFQHASPDEEWSDSESHRTYDEVSSENYLASNEGGPGSSRSFSYLPSVSSPPSSSSSSSDLPVELEQERGPVAGSNPSTSGSPAAEPESGSQKSFLSKLVSKSKSLLSKTKDFFFKLASKLKFWRRTSTVRNLMRGTQDVVAWRKESTDW